MDSPFPFGFFFPTPLLILLLDIFNQLSPTTLKTNSLKDSPHGAVGSGAVWPIGVLAWSFWQLSGWAAGPDALT